MRTRFVHEFEKICRADTVEEASLLSAKFLDERIKRSVHKECSDWSVKKQDALIADINSKFSKDWIESDLSETFLDCYLPENIDLLNILTNNISESSFKMLRTTSAESSTLPRQSRSSVVGGIMPRWSRVVDARSTTRRTRKQWGAEVFCGKLGQLRRLRIPAESNSLSRPLPPAKPTPPSSI